MTHPPTDVSTGLDNITDCLDDSRSTEVVEDTIEENAAKSLLFLASLSEKTPPRKAVKVESFEVITPEQKRSRYTLKGMKRDSDCFKLLYEDEMEETRLVVPLHRGDTYDDLQKRRIKSAQVMSEQKSRTIALCSWRGKLISVNVFKAHWHQTRDTAYQKRFVFGKLQLVIIRSTCGQTRRVDQCRNCKNKHFRASCLTPRFLNYLLPLPEARDRVECCDKYISYLEPITLNRETTPWVKRVPAIIARS